MFNLLNLQSGNPENFQFEKFQSIQCKNSKNLQFGKKIRKIVIGKFLKFEFWKSQKFAFCKIFKISNSKNSKKIQRENS